MEYLSFLENYNDATSTKLNKEILVNNEMKERNWNYLFNKMVKINRFEWCS
jgi:hypothetical protein